MLRIISPDRKQFEAFLEEVYSSNPTVEEEGALLPHHTEFSESIRIIASKSEFDKADKALEMDILFNVRCEEFTMAALVCFLASFLLFYFMSWQWVC